MPEPQNKKWLVGVNINYYPYMEIVESPTADLAIEKALKEFDSLVAPGGRHTIEVYVAEVVWSKEGQANY